MSKKLVIVESPSKSKTIEKYLGKDYKVVSSLGHIRDLSTSGNTTSHQKHIINPITKEFNEHKKVVCVKSKNSIDAEVLTTTLMLATTVQIERIKSNFKIEETIIFNL